MGWRTEEGVEWRDASCGLVRRGKPRLQCYIACLLCASTRCTHRSRSAVMPHTTPQVGRALQCEAAWCGGALPERCPALPLALLNALLGRIEKPFKQRLSVAMAAQPGEPD